MPALKDLNMLLVITNSCNMNCPFCYQEHTDDMMDSETAIASVKKYYNRINRLVFFGGEPLLNSKVILDVMNTFPELEYAIMTNMTVPLDAERKEVLNRCQFVTTSYSVDRFSNNNLFNRFLEQVHALKNKKDFELLVTITEEQLKIPAEELAILINIIGPSNVIFDRLFDYPGNPEISKDQKYYEQVDAYIGELTKYLPTRINEFYKMAKLTQTEHRAVYCGSCLKHLIILPDGNVGHLCERQKYATRFKKCLLCDITEYCGGDCLMYQDICAFPKESFKRIIAGEFDEK